MRWVRVAAWTALAAGAVSCAREGARVEPQPAAVHDARPSLAWLEREVPAWSKANKCFACHNNGDGARALFTAVRLGHAVPREVLADTLDWLQRPKGWDRNGGEGPFSDKVLARLQFAAALVEADAAGLVADRRALMDAATTLAADQQADGSWKVEDGGNAGSPATWGPMLITTMAHRTLAAADATRFAPNLRRAEERLARERIGSIPDAAAVLWASRRLPMPAERIDLCRSMVIKGQSRDGGWGPYVNAPPEVFDTALVLVALSEQRDSPETEARMRAGRAYLLRSRNDDGSWPETTRPSGAESYAQRVSTAGWATMALLLTPAE